MDLRDILFCLLVFMSIYVLAISYCPKAFSIDSLEYYIGTTKIVYPSTWHAFALSWALSSFDPSYPVYWPVEFSPINNLGTPTHAYFKVVAGTFANIVYNDIKAGLRDPTGSEQRVWQNFKSSVIKNEPGSISIKYSYTTCNSYVVIVNNVRCNLYQPPIGTHTLTAYRSYEFLPTTTHNPRSVLISLYISSPSGYDKFWNDFASFKHSQASNQIGKPIGTNPIDPECPYGTATHSPRCGPYCAEKYVTANMGVEPKTERTWDPECKMWIPGPR